MSWLLVYRCQTHSQGDTNKENKKHLCWVDYVHSMFQEICVLLFCPLTITVCCTIQSVPTASPCWASEASSASALDLTDECIWIIAKTQYYGWRVKTAGQVQDMLHLIKDELYIKHTQKDEEVCVLSMYLGFFLICTLMITAPLSSVLSAVLSLSYAVQNTFTLNL